MDKDTPEFSSKPIKKGPGTKGVKKKIVAKPKKTVTIKKKKVVKKISKKPLQSTKSKRMEESLESIYEDDNGKMPNMKDIKIKKHHPIVKGFFTLIIVLGLLAAVAWAGFFVLPNTGNLSGKDISLEIKGEEEIALGESVKYEIAYKNNQKTDLKNTVLTVRYPAGFVFEKSSKSANTSANNEWNLGEIKSGEKGTLEIEGKLYGELNQEQSWRVFLNYKPGNFNSEMQAVSTYNVSISQTPFEITATGPDKASLGNDVEYVFEILEPENLPKENLELVPNWPEDFYVISSEPELIKNEKWIVEHAVQNENTENPEKQKFIYKVLGKFTAEHDDDVAISASLNLLLLENKTYEIAKSEIATKIIKNDLNLNVAVNGSLNTLSSQPGDILNITLSLKNASEYDMENIETRLIFDAPSVKNNSILDWAGVDDQEDGDIIGKQLNDITRRGTVTWNQKHISALSKLEADGEYNINIILPVSDESEFDLTALEDHKINILAEADFTDSTGAKKTITANPIVITLNSDLEFENRYSQKGKEYGVNWVLTNHLHPLQNVKVSAEFYGDVSYQSEGNAPAGDISYDEDTKKLTWNIKDLPLDLDVLAFPFTVVLNSENPSQETLVSKVHITALDNISGEEINFMGEEVPVK